MVSTCARISEPCERCSSEEVVATYRSLANVERDFRSLKSVDVHIRPIRHRLANRVRARAFICLLAAHLVWHLRSAWAPLTFTDEARPHTPQPRRTQAGFGWRELRRLLPAGAATAGACAPSKVCSITSQRSHAPRASCLAAT